LQTTSKFICKKLGNEVIKDSFVVLPIQEYMENFNKAYVIKSNATPLPINEPNTKSLNVVADQRALEQTECLKGQTAYTKIKFPLRMGILILWIAITCFGIYFNQTFGLVLMGFGLLNYIILLVFRLKSNVRSNTKDIQLPISSIDWPTMSVIFPLKGEDAVIYDTIKAIKNLDYDKSLMQVLVVVERTDLMTLETLSKIKLPDYFELLTIPTLPPFTKGRALLHALDKVRGKYMTIFDAESRPEAMQMKKAALCLMNSKDEVCCQAKIRISNKSQNWITRNFATEYFEWFEFHLKKLSDKNLPFGLGGNSFYISTESLLKAGAWDAYNVTEDVDLSVRLIEQGVKLKILDSYTDESCPDSSTNWINQRTRWNKGLFITQLVHLKKSFFNHNFSTRGWFSFWLRMFCGTLLPFYNIYITLYIATSFRNPYTSLFSKLLWGLFAVNLLISLYVNHINYKKLGISQSLAVSFIDVVKYLMLNIFAGFTAFWEYFRAPMKWNKTVHLE
jgi:cellulose synthase/poly-beta-1,6-N-acetylglucosamine synthase-like glycosyltransferase